MIVLLPKTNIDFIGKRYVLFAVSGFFILLGLASIFHHRGLDLGIDFTGGTALQVGFAKPVAIGEFRDALTSEGINAEIQSFVGKNSFAVKVKGKQENVNETAAKILGVLKNRYPENSFTEERREFVGPAVGRDLTKKAVWALILSMFGIIIYVAFRFSNPIWGAMGVLALFHDVFVTIGFMSLTGREIDLVIVAALLTIAGYSINDTIVIFDRMRENIKINARISLGELVNRSINETLSRTIITNLTVLVAVLCLYFFGGDVINNFAFAMLVGSVSGTYSTIAIAAPLVYEWETGTRKKYQLASNSSKGSHGAQNKKI